MEYLEQNFAEEYSGLENSLWEVISDKGTTELFFYKFSNLKLRFDKFIRKLILRNKFNGLRNFLNFIKFFHP